MVSCQERDGIGLDLIDSPLVFNSTDTVSLVAYTQLDDSLYASRADYHLLGFMNDPIFGKTTASIYTEALPAVLPARFGGIPADSLVIDSVVISMAYVTYVGNINNALNLRVYELDQEIPMDSVYSGRVLATKSEIVVNNPTFVPMPTYAFPLSEEGDTLGPHLRINIDKEFGRRFINTLDTTYSNAAAYRNFFKGFLITVDEAEHEGSLLYFNLGANLSTFSIFFKRAGATTNSEYSVLLGNQTGRRFTSFNNYNHAFTSEQILSQAVNGDTLKGDSLLFLQAMGNYRVKIQMPYISDLVNQQQGDFAINSARLIVPMEGVFNIDSIDRSRALVLYRENPEKPGELLPLSDQFLGLGYFGGLVNDTSKEYVFNITRHLQMAMENPQFNTPLYLTISGAHQNATRVVIKGPARENPLRLEIKYTQPRNN